MKDRIMELAQGKVAADIPQLAFFPENLSREVPEGAVIRMELLLRSKNKIPFKSFFYSSDERVSVLTPTASGQSGTVVLEINTRTSHAHEEICGELQVVSNAGERRLEYHFFVTGKKDASDLPQTIEELAAVARENPHYAARLFVSQQFLELPFMKEPKIQAIYEGLYAGINESQEIEAFLVGCEAKEPVSFWLEQAEESFEIEEGKKNEKGKLIVCVNTWGNFRIQLSADMPWLKLEKQQLTEHDFKDRRAEISYTIRSASLHNGKNIAVILLKSDTQLEKMEIHAYRMYKPADKKHVPKDVMFQLYKMLNEYLNGSYEDEVIMANLERSLAVGMKRYPGDIGLCLFRAWFFIEAGRNKEASALLEWCRDTVNQYRADIPNEYCVFWYLDGCINKDKRVAENACRVIHKYFKSMPSLMIALLELCVVRKPQQDEDSLAFMEELQRAYGSSSLVYVLAARLFRNRPELMRADSSFTLYVFNYMRKHQCCPDAVVERFLKLVPGIRQNQKLLLHILIQLYGERKDTETLTAICSVLVRQRKTGAKYLPWYEEGIKKEVPLTSLNDYYLASLEIGSETTLPISILMYYSFKSDLDDRTKLDLYYYILTHYTKDSEMFHAYESQMNQFAINQLLSGAINKKLVLLYETILTPELIDKRLGQTLPDLLFSKQITTSLPFARRVIVRYPQLSQEFSQTVESQTACISVYTDNAAVIFEDAYGNRYIDPDCKTEKLMYRHELIEACKAKSPNQLMLLLEDTYLIYRNPIQDDKMYMLVCRLLERSELSVSYRRLLVERRIDYCYYCSQKQESQQLQDEQKSIALSDDATAWLLKLDIQALSQEQRIKVIELYIMRGCMKEAYRLIRVYGSLTIKAPLLLRLTVRLITENLYQYDEYLVSLGMYLIRKKQWNEILLTYVAKYYNGLTDSMAQLLSVTREAKINSGDLSERVVAQMMFTGNIEKLDEAYECYYSLGHVSDMVRKAYYVLKCHAYLMGKNKIAVEQLRTVEAFLLAGKNEVPAVFSFAVLQYYAAAASLTQKEKKLCEELVYSLCRKGVYLGCYLELGKHIELPRQMEGRTIVQHIGMPNEKVWMEGTRQPQGDKVKLELEQVYSGIYVGSFFMFPDELLDLKLYYDQRNGVREGEAVVASTKHSYSRKDSRYDKLCQAIRMRQDQDYGKLQQYVRQMDREKRVIEELFALM